MSARALLTALSLLGPLTVALLVVVRPAFNDPSMRVYLGLLAFLVGVVSGIAAVVLARRAHRGRLLAWTALGLNITPVLVYAVGVWIWLNSDNS